VRKDRVITEFVKEVSEEKRKEDVEMMLK